MVKRLFVIGWVFLVATILAGPALAQQRGATFVADFESGEILHARMADEPRYPASLTKIMTLYMLFDELAEGRLTLDDFMVTSPEAASRPASDLGLSAGDRLTVEQAIGALIVRSANDVAVVVAEQISGSENDFAEAMTERARELGLTDTVFKNASGLPDRGQRTTARDMARLAYSLHRDFPEYFHYFSDQNFNYGGSTWRNHNSLVGRVEGVDGLKTGFINASGFNIVVTAERHDRRIVTVVMGGRSSAVRDAYAERLIEAAYTAIDAREAGTALASLDIPRLNPVREQAIMTAELQTLQAPVAMGSSEGAPPLRIQLEDSSQTVIPTASLDADVAETQESQWVIQVGAFATRAAAQARLNEIAGSDAIRTLLAEARPVTEAIQRGERTLWRAQFDQLDARAARQVCAQLSDRGQDCFARSPRA